MATPLESLSSEVLVTIIGGLFTIGMSIILSKLNKMQEVYTTLYGVENVQSMGGIVGVVEAHDEELEEHGERLNKVEEDMRVIQQRVERLKERIDERNNST